MCHIIITRFSSLRKEYSVCVILLLLATMLWFKPEMLDIVSQNITASTIRAAATSTARQLDLSFEAMIFSSCAISRKRQNRLFRTERWCYYDSGMVNHDWHRIVLECVMKTRWLIAIGLALCLSACNDSSSTNTNGADVGDNCLIYDPNQGVYLNICFDEDE